MAEYESVVQRLGGSEVTRWAEAVVAVEASTLESLRSALPADLPAVVEAVSQIEGRLIVTGVGKSGHIARKIAATLASTGTPAQAIHPAEASHGDLGMAPTSSTTVAMVMGDALVVMTGKGLGVAAVCDDRGLIGVITDGDLRRKLDGLLTHQAGEICTRHPKTVGPAALASEATRIMNDNGITALCVVNEKNHLVGMIHLHDCLREGVV